MVLVSKTPGARFGFVQRQGAGLYTGLWGIRREDGMKAWRLGVTSRERWKA
jgi:hypothetical protein